MSSGISNLQSSEFVIKYEIFQNEKEIVDFDHFVKQLETRNLSACECVDKCISTIENGTENVFQQNDHLQSGSTLLYFTKIDNKDSTDTTNGEESMDSPTEIHEISSVDSDDSLAPSVKPKRKIKPQKHNYVAKFTEMDSLEDHYNFMPDSEKREFETTWNNRKVILEQAAEVRALSTFHANQRESRSLEQVIDLSLKEYVEMHEKAHAVRLQFEAEKSDWTRKIRQDMSDEIEAGREAQSRNRGGRGSRSKVDWQQANEEENDAVISAFRHHQQLQEEQSQDFQYFSQPQVEVVEETIPVVEGHENASSTLHPPVTSSSNGSGGTDRPNKRKFNVPVKQQMKVQVKKQ